MCMLRDHLATLTFSWPICRRFHDLRNSVIRLVSELIAAGSTEMVDVVGPSEAAWQAHEWCPTKSQEATSKPVGQSANVSVS